MCGGFTLRTPAHDLVVFEPLRAHIFATRFPRIVANFLTRSLHQGMPVSCRKRNAAELKALFSQVKITNSISLRVQQLRFHGSPDDRSWLIANDVAWANRRSHL